MDYSATEQNKPLINTWINLENIILKKRSQIQNRTYSDSMWKSCAPRGPMNDKGKDPLSFHSMPQKT